MSCVLYRMRMLVPPMLNNASNRWFKPTTQHNDSLALHGIFS
nr:MAG TPA: hypothetical protein [Caudoviricetes sp.]